MKMKKTALFAALLCAAVSALSASPTATLTWSPVTSNADGSPLVGVPTYNLYQGPQGGTLVKIQSGLVAGSASVISGLPPGTTQCFTVTAVVLGAESAQSNQACAAIPVPVPGTPTQVVVVVTG